jgi:AcrR family transcriptional regulator
MTKSTDGPRRRRSPKGEHRREEILDAGMRIFARGGYSSASIASVAEEVNLTLPGLLHHFPTKVDLLLAILERRDINSLALVGSMDGNWRESLKNLCRINRANTEIPGVVRAFSILNAESLIEDHPAVGWFANRLSTVREGLARGLRRGMDAGEVRGDVVPEDVAAEVIGMMDGLQVLWLRTPGQTDIVAIFDAYIDRLIRDLDVRS